MIIDFERIDDWLWREKGKIEEYDKIYKQRLREEGGLNIDVVGDCKNWITEKINLLFSLNLRKIKPG